MALFMGAVTYKDTADRYYRSNTKLQAGTHDSPGEKFLVDQRLGRLFQYHFGGDGYVVIPKGRIVAVSADDHGANMTGYMKDFDSGFEYPVLTLANGGVDTARVDKEGLAYTAKANRPIGLAASNVYEEIVGGFNGMQPTIENEIYVELPYFTEKSEAEAIHWGSFYDEASRRVKPGDMVMSDDKGRVVIADFEGVQAEIEAAADLAEMKVAMAKLARMQEQVIGQVWAVDTNLPGHGWLKWVGWQDSDIAQDEKKDFKISDIGTQDDFPGYPYEKTYRNWNPKTNKYYPQGIPGLTNGSNIESKFEDIEIGEVPAGATGTVRYRILQTPVVAMQKLTIGGVVVDAANYTVDKENGLVTINLPANAEGKVLASFTATGQIPGVPTNLDFRGVVGAVRILLQK